MTDAGAISCDGESSIAEIELPNVKLKTVLTLAAAMLLNLCWVFLVFVWTQRRVKVE